MKTIIFLLVCFTAQAAVTIPLKIRVTIDPPVISDQKAEVVGDKLLISFTKKEGKCVTYFTSNDHMMKFIASVKTTKVKRYFSVVKGKVECHEETEESEEILNFPNLNPKLT